MKTPPRATGGGPEPREAPVIEADGAPPRRASPALTRAVRATSSPRRASGVAGYEHVGERRERRRLAIAALALLLGLAALAVFFLWERQYASGWTYSHWGAWGGSAGNDYDEGAYDLSALLLNKGYALFSQVFSAQPAFFLPSLALVLRLSGATVAGGHLYIALCALLALLGVYWMAWTAYRPLAAPLAAALLAVSPGFLLYGHAVEAEMPMLGLCTLAVAAAQHYFLTRRRAFAALCGLLFMAGTEMKLLSPVLALPVVMLLLAGARCGRREGRSWRAIALDAAAFALCLIVPALLALALQAPSAQLQQVVIFHLHADSGQADLTGNWALLKEFLRYDPGLLLLAAAGLVLGLLGGRRRYLVLVYAAWFGVTLLFLWRYHPLFQHQLVPLLPPLALLGAAVAGPWRRADAGAARWRQRLDGLPARRVRLPRVRGRAMGIEAGALLGGLLLLIYLGLLGGHALSLDSHLFVPYNLPDRAQLAALLVASTRPSDFVACDDPMVCVDARRLPPPPLDDPSHVRAGAGYLTPAEAIAATEQYHAAAVVASRPMFATDIPAYLVWVRAHYRAVLDAPTLFGPHVFVRR